MSKIYSWKTGPLAVLAAVVLVVLSSCTAGPNSLAGTPGLGGEPAGFLLGLWHGLIAFVTFIVSLFNPSVNVYEVHNAGWPYNLGFIIGVMIAFGGGTKAGSAGRRGRKE